MDYEEKMNQHFSLARFGAVTFVFSVICLVVLGVMLALGGYWLPFIPLVIFALCGLACIGFFERADRIMREIRIDLDNRTYEAVTNLEAKMREVVDSPPPPGRSS